jgi:hypothetical protein
MLTLRPWRLSDASFIVELRNRPELMKWFRQEKPLTHREQLSFMLSPKGVLYQGRIILLNKRRIGVGAIKIGGELCLVLPKEYNLFRSDIIRKLIKKDSCGYPVWGDVFIGNPIANDLRDLGFTPQWVRFEYESSNHKLKNKTATCTSL